MTHSAGVPSTLRWPSPGSPRRVFVTITSLCCYYAQGFGCRSKSNPILRYWKTHTPKLKALFYLCYSSQPVGLVSWGEWKLQATREVFLPEKINYLNWTTSRAATSTDTYVERWAVLTMSKLSKENVNVSSNSVIWNPLLHFHTLITLKL